MELLLAVTSCQGFLQIGCCSYECVGEKKEDKHNLEAYHFVFAYAQNPI